jgi:hypothetical protein
VDDAEPDDTAPQGPLPIDWPPIKPCQSDRPKARPTLWTCFRAASMTGPGTPNVLVALWMAIQKAVKWRNAGEIPADVLTYVNADRRQKGRMCRPGWGPHSLR